MSLSPELLEEPREGTRLFLREQPLLGLEEDVVRSKGSGLGREGSGDGAVHQLVLSWEPWGAGAGPPRGSSG